MSANGGAVGNLFLIGGIMGSTYLFKHFKKPLKFKCSEIGVRGALFISTRTSH